MDTTACKYCQSSNVIKFGTYKGIQRYFCNDCGRKFVLGTLPKMKTPVPWIASAMDMYYRGMPLDSIQGRMELVCGQVLLRGWNLQVDNTLH